MVDKTKDAAATPRGETELSIVLSDAVSRGAPDDELGKLLLGVAIRFQAQNLGFPADQIPENFAEKFVEQVKKTEAGSAGEAAVERALHFAAKGDFKKSGRFFREHMDSGAHLMALEKLARRYIPVGIRRVEQTREFGERGGAEKRKEGQENRQAVLEEAKKLIKNRKNPRPPTVRQLAPDIARATNLSEPTVRRHLTKAELSKLLD